MAALTSENRTFDPVALLSPALRVLCDLYALSELEGVLVGACGIPDEVLAAPIGLHDVAEAA